MALLILTLFTNSVGKWAPSFEALEERLHLVESVQWKSCNERSPGTSCSQLSTLSSSSFEEVEMTPDEILDSQTETLLTMQRGPSASPARLRCNHATSYSCDHGTLCRCPSSDHPKSKVYQTSLTRRHAILRRERTYSGALDHPSSPTPDEILGVPQSSNAFGSSVSSTTGSSHSQDDYYNWGEVSYFEDWDDDEPKKSRLRSFSLTSPFLKANGKNSLGSGRRHERQKARRSISGLLKDLSCTR